MAKFFAGEHIAQVDLRHKDEDRDVERVTKANINKKDVSKPPQPIDVGIDLSEFYMSVEWDILQVRYMFLSWI